jgi:DNA-binding transcriptional LysR family regulator
MDFRRLSTFATVAEQGTVLKAAQLLRITQPALSRQIGGLEQDLGFKLFDRVGRRLLLTPRGEQFLVECRHLLAEARALSERAKELRRGDIKVLRVAASSEPVEGLFPTFLHRYAQRYPDVELVLVEADATEHLGMLERGEVHLAAAVINVLQLDANRFASYALPSFFVEAARAPSLGLAKAETIDIRRVCEHPLLLPRAVFATRILFDAACRLAGVKPDIFIESVSAHALLALAEQRHGVAIVPSIARAASRGLQTMRVTHKREPLRIAPAILWDKRRTLPRYAEGFSELLVEHIEDAFARPDVRDLRRARHGKQVIRRKRPRRTD